MAFYDNDNAWSAPRRQSSWEQQQPQPPSRSASTSTAPVHTETTAFALQFEEIERATDNLMKSGKWYPGSVQANAANAASGAGGNASGPARRESMPAINNRGHDFGNDHRAGPPARHQSVTEFDGTNRPGSANLQGFYAGQRFPGGRQSEAEQMLQTKRRMAAQRERELRNYHQEQQYNRTVSGAKTDRALSPTTMSEEDRRDLIARQHRALYGDNSSLYNADGTRAQNPEARGPPGRGPSPLAFDPFGQGQTGNDGTVQMPPRDRAESTASPISNAPGSAPPQQQQQQQQPPQQQSFNLLNDAQQSRRTSNSSPSGSPPLGPGQKGAASGVAPIGTRPAPGVGAPGALNKRSTTPLTPSSLSYGFNASDAAGGPNANANLGAKDERSASAASNSALGGGDNNNKNVPGLGSWGSNSGVWGSGKNTLAVQPSVWG